MDPLRPAPDSPPVVLTYAHTAFGPRPAPSPFPVGCVILTVILCLTLVWAFILALLAYLYH